MFVLQTIREFIDNPMGKGSSALPGRHLIKDDLKKRLEKILAEKKITVTIYKNDNEYYFHFLIPSEDLRRNNTYDVVLHFIPDETTKGDKNLNNYMVKFFSNSPGFTFTYAYVFNLNGLFVDELEHKFEPEIFENPPITRNPGEMISYEKTIFFACTHILDNHAKYLSRSTLDLIAKKYSETDFAKKIRNTDKIAIEIKREQNRVAQEEKEKAAKAANSSKNKKPASSSGASKINGTSRQTNGPQAVSKFSDRGKITPRSSSRSKIRPK